MADSPLGDVPIVDAAVQTGYLVVLFVLAGIGVGFVGDVILLVAGGQTFVIGPRGLLGVVFIGTFAFGPVLVVVLASQLAPRQSPLVGTAVGLVAGGIGSFAMGLTVIILLAIGIALFAPRTGSGDLGAWFLVLLVATAFDAGFGALTGLAGSLFADGKPAVEDLPAVGSNGDDGRAPAESTTAGDPAE